MAQGEIVITAGNHDHALVEPWLIARGQELEPPPLGPEQLLEPAAASPALERIAEWSAPAKVTVAYPGLWVRPDVYATHGHYLDCHLTIPTLERLTMGAMERVLGKPPSSLRGAADYESICAPMFAWRDAVARDERTGAALNGIATVTAWRALRGETAAAASADASGCPHRLRRARPRSRPPAAHPRAGGGLPAGRGGAEPRRPRPPAQRHLGRGAAPGGSAGDGAGGRPPRARASPTSSSGTPTAPGPCRGTRRGSGAPPAAPGCSTPAAGCTCRCSSATLPPRTPTGPGVAWSSTTRAPHGSGACCRASPAPRSPRPAGAPAAAPHSPRRRRDRGPASEPAFVASAPARRGAPEH